MAKSWTVTLPIAGHAVVYVEAEDAEAAIAVALAECTIENIETWEAIEQFNRGNVCFCPQPWEAAAECDDPDQEETDDAEQSA